MNRPHQPYEYATTRTWSDAAWAELDATDDPDAACCWESTWTPPAPHGRLYYAGQVALTFGTAVAVIAFIWAFVVVIAA